MKKEKGFTLIELLVVISIITILAALLLPAMGMVKHKVHSVVCLNNQKQVCQTYQLALVDEPRGSWLYGGYYKQASKILLCPEAWKVTSTSKVRGSAKSAFDFDGFISSYSRNNGVLYEAGQQADLLAFFTSPSLTPLTSDGSHPLISPNPDDLPAHNLYDGTRSSGYSGIAPGNILRHGGPSNIPTKWPESLPLPPGGINLSFIDGHVESVSRLDRLWFFKWHRSYIPPSKRPGLL